MCMQRMPLDVPADGRNLDIVKAGQAGNDRSQLITIHSGTRLKLIGQRNATACQCN